MRILHLVHQYMPGHVGGTELYTQAIAHHQMKLGHQTAVFVPSSQPATSLLPQPQMESGVRIYRIPVGPRSRGQVFRDTFYQPRLLRALGGVLAEERPDLVHVQHLMGLPLALIDAIGQKGIPLVISLHDYWYGCANAQLITNDTSTICAGPGPGMFNCGRCALARAGQGGFLWLAPLVAPLMSYRNARLRRVLLQAGAVISPTHFVLRTYRTMGLPTDNMAVIPHGIEVPQSQIEQIWRERPQRSPAQPLNVGYVGSLGWQKGVHHLIEAVNGLPPDQVRLSLYGNLEAFPDYVARLRQEASHPQIHFMGRVDRQALWPALAALDVLVLPTLWYEASPLIIQEAFAVKVPLLASRIGALPEKIRDGVDGLLFPPGDVVALCALLQELIESPQKLDVLRNNILPVRTIQDQIQEIDALYHTLRQ